MHIGIDGARSTCTPRESQLETRSVMTDLGGMISNQLDFREHIDTVVKRSSMIASWILRAFALVSPSAHVKPFESHVIPGLQYAAPAPVRFGVRQEEET